MAVKKMQSKIFMHPIENANIRLQHLQSDEWKSLNEFRILDWNHLSYKELSNPIYNKWLDIHAFQYATYYMHIADLYNHKNYQDFDGDKRFSITLQTSKKT